MPDPLLNRVPRADMDEDTQAVRRRPGVPRGDHHRRGDAGGTRARRLGSQSP